jgi:hypothetical protein
MAQAHARIATDFGTQLSGTGWQAGIERDDPTKTQGIDRTLQSGRGSWLRTQRITDGMKGLFVEGSAVLPKPEGHAAK